ncbi:hypothetical protein KFE25_009874 [Diacronema lutheri]|uniref:Uncharacterized protein n=1 Tax=Diacronema lutheri TaxID=2081491 RepID=A0A8J5XG35_DIALT|nr:hypothetical protein KFE25_009874 [Diacronema lutheri]
MSTSVARPSPFDDRMAALRGRLRATQEVSNACARDYAAISRARGGLIPDEMLSGRAGETGEQLRRALAREERLSRELEHAKAAGARALEREQEAFFIRLRQQEIHATLLAAAHDESEQAGAQTVVELALARSKADALESRLKELTARTHEDEQLMRWDLELARRERDAARLQLEAEAARARERVLVTLAGARAAEEPAELAERRGGTSAAEGVTMHGWDFSGVGPPGNELRLVRAGVRRMGESLEGAPEGDAWRAQFRSQLALVEAALDELAAARR